MFWATIGGWFTGPLGKILTYFTLALIVLGLGVGIYYSIINKAKVEQSLKDQNVQLQQVIKNQEEFLKTTKQLIEDQKKVTDTLNATVSAIQVRNEKLDAFLNSPEATKQDRPSGTILQETIKQLEKGSQ